MFYHYYHYYVFVITEIILLGHGKETENSHEKNVICNFHCSRQSLSGCNYLGAIQ